MEIFGYAPWGYEGHLVRVEVDLHRGIPGLELVGLPGNAVREARDRIRVAMTRSGFTFPRDRMLVNLSPADVPKAGSGYDLPLTLALLSVSGQWSGTGDPVFAIGELSLDGSLRMVRGTLAGVMSARDQGIRVVAVPSEAADEISQVSGITVVSASHLSLLVRNLERGIQPENSTVSAGEGDPVRGEFPLRGQPRVVRALQAVATGGHSLLLYGPPGGGKSLAARTLPSLMPSWAGNQALESQRIWSLAGHNAPTERTRRRRPFRDPHHSASAEGLLGGGPYLQPGEVSLSHGGVLLLDEAPEFAPKVLQGLREPLETRRIQVVRAGRSAWFPAECILVLTANACPCGQTGKEQGVCLCSGPEVRRYWDRIGNALMDRIDLRVRVTPAKPSEILNGPADTFEGVRRPIEAGTAFRRARSAGGILPAGSHLSELEAVCHLSRAARDWLSVESARRDWSTRGLQSVLGVARTLADLDGMNEVSQQHLQEAGDFRSPEEPLPWLT